MEVGERNQVEGKFGNTKRKFGTNLTMGKTPETSGSMVCMDIFLLNMMISELYVFIKEVIDPLDR